MEATLERELGTGEYLLHSAQARAAALCRARGECSGVLAPLSVFRRPDAVVAFTVPVVPGASLAEMGVERALSLGECITVGVGVATALAAMHSQRLAHGDVRAANVMADGPRVTLVDTMGALEDAAPATPEGDVAALGDLLRSLADSTAAPVIEAWTAPLLASDPTARPSAAHAARALARCAAEEPVRTRESTVVAVMRAAALERTVKRPQDRWWRAQKTALRLSPLVVLMGVGAFTGFALVPAVAAVPHPLQRVEAAPQPPVPTTMPVAQAVFADPAQAARELARRRVEALAAGDAHALLALSVPGSPAAVADAQTATALADGSLRFAGLELREVSVVVTRLTPGGAVVEVTTELSDYSVGQKQVPAGTATAVLQLIVTQQGWLVERILPPP